MQQDHRDAPVGVILSAGLGTRMRPLTQALPKPLLPFLNTPLLAWSLHHLAAAGVRHIGINLHHLAQQIPPTVDLLLQALRPAYGEIRVTYALEEQARGTAGGIAGLWQAMGAPQATLLSLNGDSVMDVDLASLLRQHRQHGAPISMMTRHTDGQHPGGLWVDDQQRVSGLRSRRLESSQQELDFAGVHLLEPEALERVHQAAQRATQTCMVGDVYMDLLGTPLAPRSLLHEGFWMAMDNPGLLLEATRRVLRDPSCFPLASLPRPLGKNLYVHTPGAIDDKARFAGPVLLGALASVGANAQLGPDVVIDATEIAPNTRVKNAILFGMGRVEGHWEDCVAINGQIAQL